MRAGDPAGGSPAPSSGAGRPGRSSAPSASGEPSVPAASSAPPASPVLPGTSAARRPPRLVVHEALDHGVALYARQLADAVTELAGPGAEADAASLPELPRGTALHLHFTDRLWGSRPEEAAATILRLAAAHPLTVTLHDLPQPSDGERNLPRRAACYRAVAEAATGVVCNSDHEALLLGEHTTSRVRPAVIRLPILAAGAVPARGPGGSVRAGAAPAAGELSDAVGVLGFFYPGKGHDEALEAAAGAGVPRLVVIGRASDGHEAELAEFVRRGRRAGVEVEVTGYLSDEGLLEAARSVGVPVVAHRHVSASGSLNSWITAGRRPVVAANRYVAEMARARPGTLTVVAPEALPEAVAAARARPAGTLLEPSAVAGQGLEATAAAYLAWWGCTA